MVGGVAGSRCTSRYWASFLAISLVVLVCLQAVPAASHSDEPVVKDPPVHRPVTFVLPSPEAIPKILDLGIAMEAPVRENRPGQLTLELFITPEEQRQREELGLVPLERARGMARAAQSAKGMPATAPDVKKSQEEDGSNTSGRPDASETTAHEVDQVRTLRAESFENYAGTFLSVEARSSAGDVSGVTLEVYDAGTGERIGH